MSFWVARHLNSCRFALINDFLFAGLCSHRSQIPRSQETMAGARNKGRMRLSLTQTKKREKMTVSLFSAVKMREMGNVSPPLLPPFPPECCPTKHVVERRREKEDRSTFKFPSPLTPPYFSTFCFLFCPRDLSSSFFEGKNVFGEGYSFSFQSEAKWVFLLR